LLREIKQQDANKWAPNKKMAMTKVKVKGSPQFHMKVVPYRPLRTLVFVGLWVVTTLMVAAITYFYVEQRGISPVEASAMREEQAQLTRQLSDLRQQLTQAQMNAEVDRQSTEELRQQLLLRREQIAQLEREVAVYQMMSSRTSRNPQGIGFGSFSVKSVDSAGDNVYHMKLVVQKLAEDDAEFTGHLESSLVGKQAGVEQRIQLSKLAVIAEGVDPLGEKIPLQFKYFQNIETDLRLPEGFEPVHMELRLVSASKSNPLVVQHQLEWVQAD
jgi:multidrug efflux pump subunit AcrA (membrane-fusion protein)